MRIAMLTLVAAATGCFPEPVPVYTAPPSTTYVAPPPPAVAPPPPAYAPRPTYVAPPPPSGTYVAPPPPAYTAPPPPSGTYVAPPPPRAPSGTWVAPPPPRTGVAGAGAIYVPSDRATPVYTPPLAAGRTYALEVSGAFSPWGDHTDGVDALYCDARWRCPSPQLWSQLLVDDQGLADVARATTGAVPPYSPSHRYTVYVRGAGRPLKLQIADARDGSWGDNHGGLMVSLVPTGG